MCTNVKSIKNDQSEGYYIYYFFIFTIINFYF